MSSESRTITPERQLHQLFARLFELSTQQMEALDNENFDRLAELLSQKDEVLAQLKALDEGPSDINQILQIAAQSGSESGYSLRDLVRRYQAHEKYIVRQVQIRMASVGERLKALRLRKSAASGYRPGKSDNSQFDLTG
jgi:hypothetical protein